MIKRYDLINVPCHGGWDSYDELQEVEDGGWVRYEDHAAEVERLRDTFDHTRHQVCDALEVDRGLGWTSLCMEITHIYYDHATEVERLRARVAELEKENERLRAKLEDTDRIGRDALRKGGHPAPDDCNAAYAIGWLETRNDREFRVTQAQREAAIYGAVFAAAYPHVSARVAMSHAEDAVEAWREAQKGGDDG